MYAIIFFFTRERSSGFQTELQTVVVDKKDWREIPQPSLEERDSFITEIQQFRFGQKSVPAPSATATTDEELTLDLHGLKAAEARDCVIDFLNTHGGIERNGFYIPRNKTAKIITGRGLHSENGVCVLKHVVERVLNERNLTFKVFAKGGAYNVKL